MRVKQPATRKAQGRSAWGPIARLVIRPLWPPAYSFWTWSISFTTTSPRSPENGGGGWEGKGNPLETSPICPRLDWPVWSPKENMFILQTYIILIY